MKTVKNVSLKKGLLLLATAAFVALCTFNVILGLSDYNKTLISFNLEALTAYSEGGGETNTDKKVSAIVTEEIGTITFYDTGTPEHNPYCSGTTCVAVQRRCIGTGNLSCQEGIYAETDQLHRLIIVTHMLNYIKYYYNENS
jgi:hypothetical protein